MRHFIIFFYIVFAFFGCTIDQQSSGFQLSAGGEVLTSTTDTGLPTETGDSEPDLPEPKFDLVTETEEDSIFECLELDILFVIDNSGSMSDDQEKLSIEIPGFIEKLKLLGLGTNSLHIGIVSTDDYAHNPPECQTIGALVTDIYTGYPDYVSYSCGPYADGFTFMTESDDLNESFMCASLLGSNGSGSERAIEAMIEALKPTPDESLSPFEARADFCNEGFHRRAWTNGDGQSYPGAGLVVVFITDEDDKGSPGEPSDWIEQLKWLRRPVGSEEFGNLNNTSFLALLNTKECSGGWSGPTTFENFLSMTPVSYIGNICDDNFSSFFDSAIGIVQEGCGVEVEPIP